MLILTNEEEAPSSILTDNLTLFLGKSSVNTSTFEEYFPCEEYCLSSSILKLSKTDLFYISPTNIQEFFMPSKIAYVLIALLPSIKISSIVGLSCKLLVKHFHLCPAWYHQTFQYQI